MPGDSTAGAPQSPGEGVGLGLAGAMAGEGAPDDAGVSQAPVPQAAGHARLGSPRPDASRAGRIRRSEVMRYLGHAGQEVDAELVGRIEAGIALAERTCEPRWVWRTFDVEPPAQSGRGGLDGAGFSEMGAVADIASDGGVSVPSGEPPVPVVRLAGTSLELRGTAIADFLAGAKRVALLACTLGAPADRELRRLGVSDPLGQLVFDAACTDLVEWGADRACEEIAETARVEGLVAGDRFSPGYADLPIDVQPLFLDVLQAPKRLGLTASASNLLVPTKSVTCVVGLYPAEPERGRHLGCGACNLWASCQLRLRGTPCWRRG